MEPAPLRKPQSSEHNSDSDDVSESKDDAKSSRRQISQASTTLSLEELSSPAFFSRQCTEIDSLACRVIEESNINKAMVTAAVSDRNFCVTVSNPRHSDIPFVAASEKFETMTGYRREETLGKGFRFLTGGHHENDMATLASMRVACRTGSPWTGVLIHQRKSGELFRNLVDLHGLIVATSRRTGEPLWFLIGIHADVTQEAEGVDDGADEGADEELPPARAELFGELARSIRSRLAEDFSRLAVSGALQADPAGPISPDAGEWILLPTPEWVCDTPGALPA